MKQCTVNNTLVFYIVFILFSPISIQGKEASPPDDVTSNCLSFFNDLTRSTSKEILKRLDEPVRDQVSGNELEVMVSQLQRFNNVQKLTLVKYEYNQENDVHSLVYEFSHNDSVFNYIVQIRESKIAGFNIAFNRKTNTSHINRVLLQNIFISILLVCCAATQVWCAIFFFRKEASYKRWLFMSLSFVGFPIGLQSGWSTGKFAVSLGFEIPAVSLSWSGGNWDNVTIMVFFPIGILFMINKIFEE